MAAKKGSRVKGDYLIRFHDVVLPGQKDAEGRPANCVARVYEMLEARTIEIGSPGKVQYLGDLPLHVDPADSFEEIRGRVETGLVKYDQLQERMQRGMVVAARIAQAIRGSYEERPAGK